jgi:hypothetical protein
LNYNAPVGFISKQKGVDRQSVDREKESLLPTGERLKSYLESLHEIKAQEAQLF